MIVPKNHWETIYSKYQDNELSWYQHVPETSLSLIKEYAPDVSSRIVDVGGGNSSLAKCLVEKGYSDISVLDISGKVLERNKARTNKSSIKWIEADITEYTAFNGIDVWHDRAVFHFLTDRSAVDKYISILSHAVKEGGIFILGAFSESGPEQCSGLPIKQYSAENLIPLFQENFGLVETFDQTHTTPFDTKQDFIWAVFRCL